MSKLARTNLGGPFHGPMNHQSANGCPVAAALHSAGHGGLRHVHCEVCEGSVVLHGNVRTFYLKQLAQEVVMKVDSVSVVENKLVVGYQ